MAWLESALLCGRLALSAPHLAIRSSQPPKDMTVYDLTWILADVIL